MKKYITTVRENVTLYGVAGIENAELQDLIAILIGNSATPILTGQLAAKGIVELSEMTVKEFELEGLTPLKALELHSAFLLAKKLLKVDKKELKYTITSPHDAATFVMDELANTKQEHFVVLYLNTRKQVISKNVIFVGDLNSCIVSPREIFKEAIKHSADSIILLHSHPAGNPSPSPNDVEISKRLEDVGNLMGIPVLDHIVIGHYAFVSLKEKGYF